MTITRAQLKQRVRDYLRTYPGVGTDATDADAITRYPAFEVEFAGVTSRRSGKRNVNTYVVRVFIYACEARDYTKDKISRADRVIAEAYIDPFAEFLADNPTLTLTVDDLPSTMLASGELVVSNEGVGLLDLNDKTYAGFTLDFTITK